MIPVIQNDSIPAGVLAEIYDNNCYMPHISRVIYNIGKKSYPKLDENGKRLKDENGKVIMAEPVDILATVVYFDDNTKISVVNSVLDGVTFEDVKLSDGSTVKVASEASKEMGLVYALVKRLTSSPDENGEFKNSGFGLKLREEVAMAYDSVIEHAELKIARAKSKAEHIAKLNTAKPKQKYSIKETLARFNAMLDKIDGSNADDIIKKAYSIFKD